MSIEEKSVSFWLKRINMLQEERAGIKKALKVVVETETKDEAILEKLMKDHEEIRLSLMEAKIEMLLLITVKACSKIVAGKEK